MLIRLDFDSDIPIYLQLRHQIVMGIGSGVLETGESLPTVRELARDVGVNPMTVNKAYQLLKQEGFITIDRRHGATVSKNVKEAITYKENLNKYLQLLISEASIRGISEEDFILLVKEIYNSHGKEA